MNSAILHRGYIAKQALTAARRKVEEQQDPPNPYCPHLEPEAHAAWKASFERYVHMLTEPEGCEGVA